MLIGIDASRAATSRRTGTEAYAYYLIRELIELTAGKSIRLRLYFNQPPTSNLFPSAAHVERRVIPFRRLWTQLRLTAELRHFPPDVFFTPAHVIPFTYRGPSVATIHDLGFRYFPKAHDRGQLAYLDVSTRSNSQLSARVIADTKATKTDLIRFYDSDPQKISVVYPGIDPGLRRVDDSRAAAPVAASYGIRRPYLLYLGTLQPRKNLERLVVAFARSGLKSHQLVLGGKVGWQADALSKAILAVDPSVRGRIVLPGFVAENDKAALLSAASALVFPSLYEGFGFPVLEAQACGTAVLCSNSSCLPEITAGSALLVNPLDVEEITAGLHRITEDDALRQQLVTLGYENVRRFDWRETAAGVLQVLLAAAAVRDGE